MVAHFVPDAQLLGSKRNMPFIWSCIDFLKGKMIGIQSQLQIQVLSKAIVEYFHTKMPIQAAKNKGENGRWPGDAQPQSFDHDGKLVC